MESDFEDIIKMALVAIIGTLLSWLVANWMVTQGGITGGIGNLLAVSVIGLIGGLTLKEYGPIFYTGAFAGMCSALVIPQIYWAFLMGFLVFVLWLVLEPYFEDFDGGKFGLIACISGAITAIFAAVTDPNYNKTDVAGWPWVDMTMYGDLEGWIWWFAPLFICLGVVLTKWARDEIVEPLVGEDNTTIASALVSVVGAVTVPLINAVPGMTDYWSIGWSLGLFVFLGSIIGMASGERCRTIYGYVITGIIAGFLWIAITGFLIFGGKEGLVAFLSVIIFDTLVSKLVEKVKPEWVEVPI